MGRQKKKQKPITAEKYDSSDKWKKVEAGVAKWQKRKEWIKAITIVITMLAGFVGYIGAALVSQRPKTDFDNQIARLKETEDSLNDLVKFVREQQSKLKDSETVLATLQREHEKLKPVVEADRTIVEAILLAQSENQRLGIWYERMIGIFMGIASSLIASFVWNYVVNRLQNRETAELSS